jgi:hypothetical protein
VISIRFADEAFPVVPYRVDTAPIRQGSFRFFLGLSVAENNAHLSRHLLQTSGPGWNSLRFFYPLFFLQWQTVVSIPGSRYALDPLPAIAYLFGGQTRL